MRTNGKKYLYVYGMCIGLQQIDNKKNCDVYDKEKESNISLFQTQLYKQCKHHKGSAFLLSFCCLFLLFFDVYNKNIISGAIQVICQFHCGLNVSAIVLSEKLSNFSKTYHEEVLIGYCVCYIVKCSVERQGAVAECALLNIDPIFLNWILEPFFRRDDPQIPFRINIFPKLYNVGDVSSNMDVSSNSRASTSIDSTWSGPAPL